MTDSAPLRPQDLLAGTVRGKGRFWLRAIVRLALSPLFTLRVIGVEHVPPDGPLLVVSNHLSNADPPLLELAFPRPLFFMAKQELFAVPGLSWLMKRFGAFPVERGTPDRAALRHAEKVLRQGIALGVFPEGSRSKSIALNSGYPGVGLLARQSRAPVLPVAIWGTEYFPVNGDVPPKRPKGDEREVTVRFGDPFRLPDIVDGKRVTADEATYVIMHRIAALLPERYRGVYDESSPPSGATHSKSG